LCSWFWLNDKVDFAKNIKAASLPTEGSAGAELTEGSSAEEEAESGQEKKKRIGFRDRKVMYI